MRELLRARVFHTPGNPFASDRGLETFFDGGVAIERGRVVAAGEYAALRKRYPGFQVKDLRPGALLPGFVDAHVHFPQLRIIGAMGVRLMDWLKLRALPAEVQMSDTSYARQAARHFLWSLLRNGTTSALVFGAHFPEAQDALFDEAAALGMPISSGMVISDRDLEPALCQSPTRAYEANIALIKRWHGQERIRYAVTPRFALSTSPAMLEVAGCLLREHPGLTLQTHLNETVDEIDAVLSCFPWAKDYLQVYEAFGLVGPHSVFAHNVHPTDSEVERLARAAASVVHCPTSNAFLGSGLFPMKTHCSRGINIALGSDVGAGTGFSLLKEGLMAYQVQMLKADGYRLNVAQLLYLATKGGARAMGVEEEVGDLTPGRMADLVLITPPKGSTLDVVLSRADSAEQYLGALFTLAGEESISEVFLKGQPVYRRARHAPKGGGTR